MLKPLLLSCLAVAMTQAATLIEISTQLADVPAGTEVPSSVEKFAKLKGVDVISSPRVIAPLGKSATIEVAQPLLTPNGGNVPLGVKIEVTTSLTEKGNVRFSGVVTDRFKQGEFSDDSIVTLRTVARELHFRGWVASGGSVILSAEPPTASGVKKGIRNVQKARDLVVLMTLTKKESATAPATKKTTKPAPVKKKK